MLANTTQLLPCPRLSRFAYLMGLYGENYQRLHRLFDPERLPLGRYVSALDDGLDVHVELTEQHRYTLEMRLTYSLVDPLTGEPDPSAHLRLYRDARQVEASHCYIGRRWQDVLGLWPQPRRLADHRLRMNSFLSKWLEYLSEQGHSRFTLRAADSQPSDCNMASALDTLNSPGASTASFFTTPSSA